jgi:hypothetical protein
MTILLPAVPNVTTPKYNSLHGMAERKEAQRNLTCAHERGAEEALGC